MTRIQRDILRLQAEQKVKEGERGGADGRDGSAAYEAAAAMYLQSWEQYGRAACEAKSSSGCERWKRSSTTLLVRTRPRTTSIKRSRCARC